MTRSKVTRRSSHASHKAKVKSKKVHVRDKVIGSRRYKVRFVNVPHPWA